MESAWLPGWLVVGVVGWMVVQGAVVVLECSGWWMGGEVGSSSPSQVSALCSSSNSSTSWGQVTGGDRW